MIRFSQHVTEGEMRPFSAELHKHCAPCSADEYGITRQAFNSDNACCMHYTHAPGKSWTPAKANREVRKGWGSPMLYT